MTAPMRLLDTGLMPTHRNVALAAAMAELHRAGQIPDTLRLYLNPPAVLVGPDQRPSAAVYPKACRRRGVDVSRGLAGTGAMYLDAGILAFDLIAERRRFGARAADVGEHIGAGIAAGIARFGVPARFVLPDGVEIDGRRVAETCTLDGATIVVQGALRVDIDIAELAAILRLPVSRASCFRRLDAGARLAARLTSLAEWLGRVPAMDEVKRLFAAGVAHRWRRDLRPEAPSALELALADRLFDAEIGSNAGTPGAIPPPPAARDSTARNAGLA